MITVTDLHGNEYLLNADHIEKVEHNPDTQVVMLNGHRYYIRETFEEIATRVVDFRAICQARAATVVLVEKTEE